MDERKEDYSRRSNSCNTTFSARAAARRVYDATQECGQFVEALGQRHVFAGRDTSTALPSRAARPPARRRPPLGRRVIGDLPRLKY